VASPNLDHALSRLESALGQLEAAARRRLEVERGRANLETELTLMQDDRARLAVELDGAMARIGQVEGAAHEVDRKLEHAMTALAEVIARAEAKPDDDAEQDS